MELSNAIKHRKSIRRYKTKPIEKEKLNQLFEAAIQAPSWKNSQTHRYYCVTHVETLRQLKQALPLFNQENVKDAPVLIVSAYKINRSGFKRDGTPENELGQSWGSYDLGISDENLLLKATELGLGTLVMGLRDSEAIRQLLNIPMDESIVSVIGLGYPDINPEPVQRKSLPQIVTYIE